MSRNPDYQRMLNSKRWKELRQWKLSANPLCELCEAKGVVRSAIDIHHRQPVEEAGTLAEMEARCFNPANLQSLCVPHHAKIHREARSHSRQAHRKREDDRHQRRMSKLEEFLASLAADEASSEK